jgi:hypothetical protein
MRFLLIILMTCDLSYGSKINWEFLDTIIFYVSQKNGIEFYLLKSIVMTESSGRIDVVSKTNDFGLTQISQLQIDINSFDKEKILTDPIYALECTSVLLKTHCGDVYIKGNDDCWEKYHSKTPSIRSKYSKRVRTHYEKLITKNIIINKQHLKEI